jgi:hypothetical protein
MAPNLKSFSFRPARPSFPLLKSTFVGPPCSRGECQYLSTGAHCPAAICTRVNTDPIAPACKSRCKLLLLEATPPHTSRPLSTPFRH